MHRSIATAALLVGATAAIGATALAQAPTDRFVPVTDAMLAALVGPRARAG